MLRASGGKHFQRSNVLTDFLGQTELYIKEDNSPTISTITRGYSQALRYLKRTQRIDLGFLHGVRGQEHVHLEKADTSVHKGDFFTKALNVTAFRDALARINVISCGR